MKIEKKWHHRVTLIPKSAKIIFFSDRENFRLILMMSVDDADKKVENFITVDCSE